MIHKDASEKRDLRLELRVKNNFLWEAIRDSYPSVLAFCRSKNIKPRQLYGLISFGISPFKKDGGYRSIVRLVSKAFGKIPRDLFPKELYARMLEIGSSKEL